MDDDSLLQMYNQELIALSQKVSVPKHLSKVDAAAKAVSPICGSEVDIELQLEGNRVAAFGYAVEACALTKAVVAVMDNVIVGKERSEIHQAGQQLRAMLEEGAPPPTGAWADLKIMQPVTDYKARHNSILLPFEAIERAFEAISN